MMVTLISMNTLDYMICVLKDMKQQLEVSDDKYRSLLEEKRF
jgi:hypothetical protein